MHQHGSKLLFITSIFLFECLLPLKVGFGFKIDYSPSSSVISPLPCREDWMQFSQKGQLVLSVISKIL